MLVEWWARSARRRLVAVTAALLLAAPLAPGAVSAHAASASKPTAWKALNAAIAKIPTYKPGSAKWVVSSKFAFWGTADWYDDVLYVSPLTPTPRLYDVAVHEWSHELSVLDYGGDVGLAMKRMDHFFGGKGLVGAERAADCMAILQGAVWTHYTQCRNIYWRHEARRLVRGHRLA